MWLAIVTLQKHRGESAWGLVEFLESEGPEGKAEEREGGRDRSKHHLALLAGDSGPS